MGGILPVNRSWYRSTSIETHFRRDTQLLIGWLGSRGLASVVFTLIVYEAFHANERPHEVLFAIAGWMILLSILLHGFSALPLASWYANRLKDAPASIPELKDVSDLESNQYRLNTLHHAPAQMVPADQRTD